MEGGMERDPEQVQKAFLAAGKMAIEQLKAILDYLGVDRANNTWKTGNDLVDAVKARVEEIRREGVRPAKVAPLPVVRKRTEPAFVEDVF
jgi:hypothetical protein